MDKQYILPEAALFLLTQALTASASAVPGLIQGALSMVALAVPPEAVEPAPKEAIE